MFSKPQFTAREIADLDRAYQDAIYKVYYGDRTIQLFIDRPNSKLDSILKKYNVTSWALITAFNPYSQCLSAVENRQRHQSLMKLVQSLNLTFFDAVGKDENSVWTPEQSIFVMGIDLEQAIAIGRKFQQNAIIFGELEMRSQLVWL